MQNTEIDAIRDRVIYYANDIGIDEDLRYVTEVSQIDPYLNFTILSELAKIGFNPSVEYRLAGITPDDFVVQMIITAVKKFNISKFS